MTGISDIEKSQFDYSLYLISHYLQEFHKTLENFALPSCSSQWEAIANNHLDNQKSDYDLTWEQALAEKHYIQLNSDQCHCFDCIVNAVIIKLQKTHFFIQDSDDTGKIFLYHALYSHFLSEDKTVLCVTSSGIAAVLLFHGWTAHSWLHISLDLSENLKSRVTAHSKTGQLLQTVDVIIWDEIFMQHHYCFEFVHHLLCRLQSSTELFDEIFFLLDESACSYYL